MTYRTDKFAVGDKVTLHPDYVKRAFIHNSGSFPMEDTVYTISKVVDVPYVHARHNEGQSNHSSMNHTQHVGIAEDPNPGSGYPHWSGAWWLKVGEET